MAFIAVLINARQLEDREIPLRAVHMGFPTRPFLGGVVDTAVSGEAAPYAAIGMALVALALGIVENCGTQSVGSQNLDLD